MLPQELSLNSEIFEEFRTILDSSIRALLRQMIEQRVKSGTITAKVDIDLASKTDEETAEISYFPSIDPKVTMKLGKRADYGLRKLNGFTMKSNGRGGFTIGTEQVELSELFTEGENR